MTDEEYLRNRLDRLNQNSHYGIMIDTEITSIVRNLIKRLEEKEMNATSVQTIENVKEMHFTIEKSCVDDITKVIVGASTNDDIFEFHFSGEGCVVFADQWFNAMTEKVYKQDWESEKNKRQMMERENSILRRNIEDNKKKYEEKIRELEKELGKWKKETADCLRLRDEVRREKNKEINELKWQLQMKGNIIKRNDELREELALEKAANEAQHKFIREYAGKDTEVQFNFAIDDAKEVSYVIVDKEENECKCESCSAGASYEEMYRNLRDKLEKENKRLQQENGELKYMLNDIKFTKDLTEMCLNTRAGILEQAKKCVCGQREQDYGTPESNFKLIADLWNDYLKKEQSSIVVDAKDVAMMMALMKIARIRNGGGSGDSFVDLAGYAACGGEIWHGQKAKDQN